MMMHLRSLSLCIGLLALGLLPLSSCSKPVTANPTPEQPDGLTWVIHPRQSTWRGLDFGEVLTQQLGGLDRPWISKKAYQTVPRRRTVGTVIRQERDSTGVIMSTKIGTSGWTMLVRKGGQLQLLHHNGCLNATSAMGVIKPGTFHSVYWDFGTGRSTVYVDDQILTLDAGKDGCEADATELAPHTVGAYESGRAPFQGTIYYVAHGERLVADQQKDLLHNLEQERRFLTNTYLNIQHPKPNAVYQRQWDNSALINVRLANAVDELVSIGGVPHTVAEDGTISHRLKVQGPGRHVLSICAKTIGCQTLEYMVGDVFLLSGQSNAQGSTKNMQQLPDEALRTTTRLYDPAEYGPYWKDIEDKSWVTHFCSRYQQYHQVPCAVVRFAVGSTGIHQWRPNAASGYLETLKQTLLDSQGLSEYPEDRERRIVKAVLWQHGETDSKRGEASDYYGDDLMQIVDAFPNTRWFASNPQKLYLEDYTTREKQLVIRQAIIDAIGNHKRLNAGPDFFEDRYDLSVANKVHYYTEAEANLYGEAWVRLFL